MKKEASFEEIFQILEEETFDPNSLEYEFYSPFDESKFLICNRRNLKEKTFTRLSKEEMEMMEPISHDVAFLARHSAGIQLRFKTNSRVVKFIVTNHDVYDMKNMTFIASSGFDSYYREDDHSPFKFHLSTLPLMLGEKKWMGYPIHWYYKKDREYIINFPLFNGVLELEIGVEKGSYIEPVKRSEKKKILCYGTSILQGASCSRPGIDITNQISRYFDQEVINLAFSGAARLEKEVAEIISKEKDLEFISIDAEANAGIDDTLIKRFDEFIKTILEVQKDLPIVVFNRDRFNYDDMSKRHPSIREYNSKYMKEVVDKYASLGHKIFFFDKFDLFNDIEFTIEGLHPTDVGMNKIAAFYIETFKKVKELIK